MSSRGFSLIRASEMRATVLDRCGRPAYGEKASATTDGFVSIADTPTYTDGTEITQDNANGRRCVYRPAVPEFRNRSLVITFCNVDPEFFATLTGVGLIYDPVSGDAIGIEDTTAVDLSSVLFALETWSENGAVGDVCSPDDEGSWVETVWPMVRGGRLGAVTFANAAINFTIEQAITLDGSQWGAGPYLVYRDADGELLGLPEPAKASTHRQMFATSVAPPTVSGYQGLRPLDNPSNPAATGVTAGIPGTFTPVGNRRPATFAELEAADLTATPATAWSAGQYASLLDGTRVRWDGDEWVIVD